LALINRTKSLVDWSVHHVSSEEGDQDDRETDEGSIDQHDLVLVVHLAERVVVKTQTCQGDDLRKCEKI
jgi:hypothetical protein